ncbi:hypothetical protein AK830_g8679 [Neonectria ditissima]|uniref:C2H2-type domain-containing protein n=1 Tax=Neonectria ditissima TaxID=78410 RepID=A0A0P7BBU3_9HYPO|nr:hypothetical protein AK830_g8679 [Neonectria ditissima]
MNYSNMIEEKNLKKTFIIATLCSTLVGTFTSSMGLWDRVKDKRKQQRRDTTQDDDIKKLKAYVERSEKREKEQGRAIEGSRDRDEVAASFQRSGALISREFEDGYERLGRDFAIGDVVTENKLQAQVIALQQTVINVLQDALYNGRPLDRADMAKLVAASDAARDGSLGALRQQRQRLLMATEDTQRLPQGQLALGPPRRASTIVSSQSQPQLALGPPRRSSTISSSHSQPQLALGPPRRSSPSSSQSQLALGPPKRASTVVQADPLYCRYSLDLQYVPSRPLAASFAPGGDCQCPACGVQLAVESDDCWAIGKRASRLISVEGYKREIDEDVEFIVDQRFVIKCHTPDGEYACVLCNRYRDGDVICATADALVNHVGRAHDITELEREPDFQLEHIISKDQDGGWKRLIYIGKGENRV